MNISAHKLNYRDFAIVVKQDFGGRPHLIDGMPCMWGYVVTAGPTQSYPGSNAMPGATWFQTVKDAKKAIDVFIEVEGNAEKFWNKMRRANS